MNLNSILKNKYTGLTYAKMKQNKSDSLLFPTSPFTSFINSLINVRTRREEYQAPIIFNSPPENLGTFPS